MYDIYLMLVSAVTVLMTCSISINLVTIQDTPGVCRALTSYPRATTTVSACFDDTDGTTGTCNGSQTPYVSSLPSSAIKIPSFDWDKGNRYSEWLRFRIELDSIFDTPTCASLTCNDQTALIVHWMAQRYESYIIPGLSLNVMQWN